MFHFFAAIALSAPPAPTIDDLAFIAGSWRGELGPMIVEETWFEPVAGNMTGVFRMAGPDAVQLVEIMTIAQSDDGLVYRLRHFDQALVPWASEANGPIEAGVAMPEPGRAVFTPTDPSHGVASIGYELIGEELVATLTFAEGSGRDPFVMRFVRTD
ncbi:MAG: DUF6265 family protein [Planctomycetota bacterium]